MIKNHYLKLKHSLNDRDLDRGYFHRSGGFSMEEQKNHYDYFLYLEHDIKFSENNLQYWQKHQEQLNKKNYHLGFLIYEKNHEDKENYSIHILKKLNKYIELANNIIRF